ncbi:MAG: class I SAM-dependent methyltransferase [Betaproteobacteria bacterium]|jgi:hypothetical protein|nr:class I SAM-dependent methyltransferase [Opitutae bacterium]MBT6530438.1 class I SAM-dependent methyltransferase [Betaproteobacteria bacterium]
MKVVSNCKICGSTNLQEILNLGCLAFTGIFPKSINDLVEKTPLRLVWCRDCTLVQIGDDYDLKMLYGDNYGYRSGLNPSMVAHLKKKATHLKKYLPPSRATILDIGSNDGTFLGFFSGKSHRMVGVDPSAGKFRGYYLKDIELFEDFFGLEFLETNNFHCEADLITSISMFYDLLDPSSFVAAVRRSLGDRGIWHFEQSYLPMMLASNAFDTVCHEHIEYYSLKVIEDLLNAEGLEVISASLNQVNGGSIAVTAAPVGSRELETPEVLSWLRKSEAELRLDKFDIYSQFANRSRVVSAQLKHLILSIKSSGKTVSGYGASTKGNVTLQYSSLGADLIDVIYEVNKDKFGKVTPGSGIPIVSEKQLLEDQPDYLLVLPWHFREFITLKCSEYIDNGGTLIYPMPYVDLVSK